MIDVGRKAPDFIAPAIDDGTTVELELYRLVENHRAVVLLSVPATFVPACTAELAAVRDAGWDDTADLAVVGLSADSLFATYAYADRFDLRFPIVSDFSRSVADSYDLLADSWETHSDIPRRATIVIDDDWTVRFAEATRDALDHADPAPTQRATGTLREIGFDVARPSIDYDRVA